jgi:type III pantothenate kinase
MIDGMVRRFVREMGSPTGVKVVATGGISAHLQGISTEIQVYDPDLTLKGMAYLYEALRKK